MRRDAWIKKNLDRELVLSKHQGPGPFSYALVLDHLKPSFNVGKIYRTAFALGCQEIHLVAVGTFDPGPSKGSVRRVKTVLHSDFGACHDHLMNRGFKLFGFDPRGTHEMGQVHFPEKSAFIFGNEETGLSFTPDGFSQVSWIRIPQFGQVESLNVSIAASLAAYEFVRQRGFKPGEKAHP